MREILLVLVSLGVWPSLPGGQDEPGGPAAVVLFRDVARGALSVDWWATPSDSVKHDITGTMIVGGIGGALLLAIPGALIGGSFRKGDSQDSPSD